MQTLKQRFMDILQKSGELQINFTSEAACRVAADELILAMNEWGNASQNKFTGDTPGTISEEHYKQILQDQHDEQRASIAEDKRNGRLDDVHGWV